MTKKRTLGAAVGLTAAALLAPASPAQAAGDRSFSVTCIATDSRAAIYVGSVTMTGTWHYAGGDVSLRNARIRANDRMFTITSDRLYGGDTAQGFGPVGTYSAGESSGAWSPPRSIQAGWALWRLHGFRTNQGSDVALGGCSARG